MAKWADYLISAVRFNAAGTHIDKVKVHEDQDTNVGAPQETSRQEVIKFIKAGYSYRTIFKGADGNWKQGEIVKIVTIESVEYIKTVTDKTKADNLDNLPEF